MSRLFVIIGLLFLNITLVIGQIRSYNFYLLDEASSKTIENAHGFFANTTFGSYSDDKGFINVNIPAEITEDFIISHIGYEVRLIEFDQYQRLNNDTIFLKPNPVEIDELLITAKRDKKWKKRFKKFQEAFLGKNKIAKKCEILNPEVLRFEETNGKLYAYANDLLKIKNEYSGYDIQYWLTHFTYAKDGSIEYAGKSSYLDISDQYDAKKIKENREDLFLKSPKHFFQSLLSGTLTETGYAIDNVKFENNVFSPLPSIEKEEFIQESHGDYFVYFPEFLKIINKKVKSVSLDNSGLQLGGLESQRFTGTRAVERTNLKHATSYIYKLKPYLILNKYGNVLNSKEVKEYGYWAEQKLAHQLPFDYGNDYDLTKKSFDESISHEIEKDRRLQLLYILLYENNKDQVNASLYEMLKNWNDDLVPSLVEIMRLRREEWLVQKINDVIINKTKSRNFDFYDWLQWMWSQEENYGVEYPEFKANIYQNIDPKFSTYFMDRDSLFRIRLDEVLWGGVKQDGIPPLRMPKMISANEADYLDDDNVVFGMYINGEARAYPKRILAWHEFVVDEFLGKKIAGVYCTLCGTVIAYDMTHDGTFHDLGTSGFLYRSNKLMYDKATQSLWSTIDGAPVIGPLVDQGIELETYPVVTTTWLDWKNAHPDTKVFSLDTGHQRNYDEGAAYAAYFETDDLMFPVPNEDKSLANKAEVMIVRSDGYQDDPLAVSVDFLKEAGMLQENIGDQPILYISDKSGYARAYIANDVVFKSFEQNILLDENDNEWRVNEMYISHPDGTQLRRLSSHNIFWFAWYNAYPETRLVK